jgi:uncharacterized membrane protein
MNEPDRLEFLLLQRQQRYLEGEVTTLGERIEQLRSRVDSAAPVPEKPVAAPVIPPPLPVKPAPEPTPAAPPFVAAKQATPAPANEVVSEQGKSFEMRLGTYWLVRIGIVMLLTSLVFLGNYAYKNFVVQLGAPGKVGFLYLVSGALLGIGAWFSRGKQKESLKNFGQVLFAGGLAAVYFVTYAAHYYENLRVIESPVVDGMLLLGWAAGVVVLADRRKSEVLALFAVGLAYYSSIITHIGLFTLYSNLVLTAASVYFLIRNRWTTLSFASLLATYAGFLFWRFYSPEGWRMDWRENFLWNGNIFLGGYWLVFTAAAFLSREGQLQHQRRAGFASFNNFAFFLLVILSMFHHRHGRFWIFSICFGVVLLVLAYVARRLMPEEKSFKNAYVVQGLLLVTVGLIAHYTGLRLALLLAAETVLLFMLGLHFENAWLRRGSYITGLLATGWATFNMDKTTTDAVLGSAVGALLVFNSIWARKCDPQSGGEEIRRRPAYFAFLGLWTWLIAINVHAPVLWRSPMLAAMTLALTASYYVLRHRELVGIGQLFLMVAVVRWMFTQADHSLTLPWWNPMILIGSLVIMSHWWQRQQMAPEMGKDRGVFQGLYAFSFIAILFLWLHPRFAPENWLAFTSLLAVGITAYGIATRAWFLAGCGQFFLWISAWEFMRQITQQSPSWFVALTPIVTLIGTVMGVSAWLDAAGEKDGKAGVTVRGVAQVYHLTALVMSLWWVHQYIPSREQFWVLTLMATALFALGGWTKSRAPLAYSAVIQFTAWSWFLFFARDERPLVYGPNFLAILVLPTLQRIARHFSDRFNIPREVHGLLMTISALSLWVYISRWVTIEAGGHFYLTASWAGVALFTFGAGFLLRERTYRWLGLAILAFALGRVVLIDVWKLATIYRILSFTAMGIVPIVIGFIYNKYEEKLRACLQNPNGTVAGTGDEQV